MAQSQLVDGSYRQDPPCWLPLADLSAETALATISHFVGWREPPCSDQGTTISVTFPVIT
jgi:hypothetical protein